MAVGHAIQERYDYIQPRFEHGMEFAHPFHHPGHLLRHLPYRLDGNHHTQGHHKKRHRKRPLIEGNQQTGHEHHDDQFRKHGNPLCYWFMTV